VIGRVKHAVDWRFRAIIERLDSLAGRTARLEAQVGELGALVHALAADDAGNRRRLYALRADPGYAEPFTAADPLVSITVPTRGDRPELLARALRSLLAQTHQRLEILVVADGPEPLDGVDDPRIHYANLTQRTLAHADPQRHWLVGSTMARNEATRLARGAWLLHFDDDDTLRPDAIAALLELARAERVEVAYGGFVEHSPRGTGDPVHAFPPAEGRFGWQGALVHGGLRFFERELVAAHLGVPGDMFMLRRMLSAGVRFAALDRVVWDYYPSRMSGGGPAG
jgi:hypothetical protein